VQGVGFRPFVRRLATGLDRMECPVFSGNAGLSAG
jgi:hydrogenase maturation factor HypF (carbamoyltransferase family)